ncbi:GNAT family N-acetyltransferase [Pleionea sp. CnH1-48]|uniref:GNAT family N-acetyltransferase n=1 Tax=Pleionea sp. CnH1-48 TaxID=2954494 RepID=UPI002097F46A|nr:GNAT family N-acetyltransferase [Pleionea sp. CnH1-48]MCO7224606.1 GNAT family N-acetyltransferase [Pleionea sp. CnH1-48]
MIEFREMAETDVSTVIELIDSHDEDDAEEAQATYEESLEHHYVLTLDQQVIGVTGFKPIPHSNKSCWLSWTYVHKRHCGNGYGRKLLQKLLQVLNELEARKIFVKTSDYCDPEDGPIYAAALHLYQSIGFEIEVELADFYDEGEKMIILGYNLQSDVVASDVEEVAAPIRFNDIFEIAETTGSYCFGWEMKGRKHFDAEDLEIGINAVKDKGGRCVFLTFPSNLPEIHKPMQEAGFQYFGQLADYYDVGIHELHFGYQLTGNT